MKVNDKDLKFAPLDSNNISLPSNIYYPLMPYPLNIPSINESTPITENNNSNMNTSEEYPSELNSDELYSYNSNPQSFRTTHYTNEVNPLDILKNFDFSYSEFDFRDKASSKNIDKIFDVILNSHPDILATLKAYRVPYPIATLVIKKVIKISLANKN